MLKLVWIFVTMKLLLNNLVEYVDPHHKIFMICYNLTKFERLQNNNFYFLSDALLFVQSNSRIIAICKQIGI